MKIHIKTEDGFPDEKTITLDDGSTLANVLAADIRIRPDEVVTATLTFMLPWADLNIKATVTEAHLRELAETHGFILLKKAVDISSI
ncbi:MAG: hypothetical protein Q7T25_14145 [Sideroxyarcus sp.]|nr:hypothetical protein [Sideroxyarcus sp.]